MTRGLPDIDFCQIRPYGPLGSRTDAFEELASILIEQGVVDWPEGVRFSRFGNPDGGREGRGVLPNGDVWAWQAKYLFTFDDSAAGQVSKSVKRALDLEPTLKRYFVALPYDLPAGDTEGKKSAFTRWTEKVTEWEGLASGEGREIEFVFVGAHDLLTVLTGPGSGHAGRARYWFGADVLSPVWQERRLEEVVAKAGRRYSPQLHIDVEAVAGVDAVGRSDAFVGRWQGVLAGLRRSRRWGWQVPDVLRSASSPPEAKPEGAVPDGAEPAEDVEAAADGASSGEALALAAEFEGALAESRARWTRLMRPWSR